MDFGFVVFLDICIPKYCQTIDENVANSFLIVFGEHLCYAVQCSSARSSGWKENVSSVR